jgi:viologen exporter family transport system permease protein
MENLLKNTRPLRALFRVGWETSRQDKVTRFALGSLYVGLVIILAGLYRMTPFERLGNAQHLTFQSVVWYMAITELIAIAVWTQYREVREDVLNHHISGLMVMPVSYFGLKTGEWLGRSVENMIRFLVLGALVAYLLTGGFALELSDLPSLVLSLLLAIVIFNNIHLLIGLTEVWGAHARPVFLIVQKMLFLFGGLLLPLEIYPSWIQNLAWATPFPAILYGPASFAFEKTGSELSWLLVIQIFWVALTSLAAITALGAARRKIGRDGD